jgi:hypothetical protein
MSETNSPTKQIDLAALTSQIENATNVFEMAELNGLAQAALAERIVDLRSSIEKVQSAVCDGASTVGAAVTGGASTVGAAVTGGADCVANALKDVRCAIDALTCEIGKLQPVSHIAEHLSELLVEVRNVKDCVHSDLLRMCDAICPLSERVQVVACRSEQFRIVALENANEVTRAHLEHLERMVDEAMRSDRLGDFLEHTQRWADPPPPTRKK